jgi:hypothetical protein
VVPNGFRRHDETIDGPGGAVHFGELPDDLFLLVAIESL